MALYGGSRQVAAGWHRRGARGGGFRRYYAQQARLKLGREELKGPTGERNELFHEGRGVFVCVSPWNFPLAIYLGQISAALVAGNTVLAAGRADQPDRRPCAGADVRSRPAEGGNRLPAGAMAPPAACSVAIRGWSVCASPVPPTRRASSIASLPRGGAIATLIAETGGQNAMIVDSTALPEQVIKDAVGSAFTSAGQRCSALRVLYVQRDIADRVIELLKGAMAELRVGPTHLRENDIGPVIDQEAREACWRISSSSRAKGA